MARISLVLEGGGMRGLYTAGVLDYFLDKGLIFQDIIGVSAGACNSVSYITKQRGRTLEINAGYCADKRYISLLGFFTRGSIFNLDFLFDDIPNKLVPFDYDKYKASECRLIAVSTDCETGKGFYAPINDMKVDGIYVRASSSIPLVSPIVEVNGRKLVDGGPSDSIPIHYSVNSGFDKHIIVLTRQQGYIKKKNKLHPFCKLALKKYPNLVDTMKYRHIHYNDSLKLAEQLEKENKAIIIRPKNPVKVSRFEKNPENLRELYNKGYEDAKEKFEAIIGLCKDSDNVRISRVASEDIRP
ncbi:MAG: patatin-like phospholipase family protein [Ruminiclostridium sp.]